MIRLSARIAATAAFALLAAGLSAQDSERLVRRIAFGSCMHQDKEQSIWREIRRADPDFFLFLGDNVYGDTDDMAVLRAKYAKFAAEKNFRKARGTFRSLATWDDHDYGQNDAGAEYPMRDESQAAFLDFFGVPQDSPRRARKGVYHAEIHGPEGRRVQFVMLDTRYHRSALKKDESRPRDLGPYVPTDDPEATVLGEEQWTWLGEQLRKPAEVRVIASSIQVVPDDHGWEKWGNMPLERERLYALLRETGAECVVLVSGDRHLGEISMDREALDYPLYEVTSSGLTQSRDAFFKLETNSHRIGTMSWGDNFGVIEIDWKREPEPQVRLQLRDAEGDVMMQQKLPMGLLRHPKQ